MAGEEKELKQVQGHCPKCGPQRYADVVGQYEATETDEVSGVWATTTHRMLRCGGCKTVYFQESYVFSEDYDYDHHPVTGDPMMEYNVKITYWPAPAKRARPEWLSDLFGVDRGLHDLLEETYNVLDVDARVLAATGVRTTFDRASELLGVDPSLSFNEKLDEFLSNGKIGGDERKHLAILTDAGGAAAHRG
jgi:hypothetical protein